MGNRAMNTPSQSGRTVARRIVPKAARRRQKRALRRTAKVPTRAKPAKQLKRKHLRPGASTARRSAKTVERQQRKRTFRRIAKAQKPPKPSKEPRKKRPRELPVQAQKPDNTTRQKQQPEQEPVTDEAGQPLDYLKDGVVEWGIKSE